MAEAEDFKKGETVRLKSGGPDMTVRGHTPNGENVIAQWFAGKKLEQGSFPPESLERNGKEDAGGAAAE